MLQNRRVFKKHQHTLPSPQTYPYQWLWDSCFHAIILSYFDLKDAKKELLSVIQKQFGSGMIPHMIYWQKETKTDFPVIEWGKEDTSTITQPPMLAYVVWEIFKKDTDEEFLKKIYPSLVKFYNYFLIERDPHRNHLISLVNPDESGEDNSPRFDINLGLPAKHSFEENFQKRLELIEHNKECNFDTVLCMRNFFWFKDVPMNAIFKENLEIMSKLSGQLADKENEAFYQNKAERAREGMRELMLEDKVFWSIYFDSEKGSFQKVKIKTWAIFAPLFAGIPTKEEADYIVERFLLNNSEFNTPFMVPTVSLAEPSFDASNFWRGPVWVGVNWFIVKGLKRYGYDNLAKKITEGSLSLLERSGFREYFNPLTGEGLGAKNFTWGGLVLDM